jgi:radical SAM superfamily enzyme YgiQ (UPF0313 family)
MINGSFVFGLDDDDKDVFKRTVDWAVKMGLTTCTFHILTPYPGTKLFSDYEKAGRILHRRWDEYDTRQVVYKTIKLSAEELKHGYDWAYENFYSWTNIARASYAHHNVKHMVKHFTYAGGWKKFEGLWNFVIKTRQLNSMRPLLEAILSKVKGGAVLQPVQASQANLITPKELRVLNSSYEAAR